MKDKYDVIIVGAGPAGLACAIELQKSDKSVLILEKNSEIGLKICAGGLTAKFENLGFSLNDADKLFSSVRVSIFEKEIPILQDKDFIATIGRSKLGKILYEKLSEKVEVHMGVKVEVVRENYIETEGKKIYYEYLVGADGSNSTVRKFLGLKNKKFAVALQYAVKNNFHDLEIFFDSVLFGPGYAWIFPHENQTLIGCGREGTASGSELRNNFEKWLKKENIDTSGSELTGFIVSYDYQGFDFGNKFLIGDAAGFASGFTGEGIYFAMVSGMEVAKKISDSSYKCEKIDEILKIKKKHEKLLNFELALIKFNPGLLKFFYRFVSFFLKFKWVTKKVIQAYF